MIFSIEGLALSAAALGQGRKTPNLKLKQKETPPDSTADASLRNPRSHLTSQWLNVFK